MSLTLADFLSMLDRHAARVPLADLTAHLAGLALDLEQVGDYVRFDAERYRRNLLHEGPAYQALILCWRGGQRSPIHDHRGSSCGVRVLRGVATETVFARTRAGHVYAKHTREWPAGSVCGSQDSDIHQMSNLQPDEDLVTLHVYSPPLLNMGIYSLTDIGRRELRDPVYASVFSGGEGI